MILCFKRKLWRILGDENPTTYTRQKFSYTIHPKWEKFSKKQSVGEYFCYDTNRAALLYSFYHPPSTINQKHAHTTPECVRLLKLLSSGTTIRTSWGSHWETVAAAHACTEGVSASGGIPT